MPHFRLDVKGWRFYVALTHSQKVKGVNSKLPNGKHFLMWDFDGKEYHEIKNSLQAIQRKFKLPKIYLVNTGLEGYYHAYCFKSYDWGLALNILASTEGIDLAYFRIGVIRGYFTLRFTPKGDRDFIPAEILISRYKEDVDPLL